MKTILFVTLFLGGIAKAETQITCGASLNGKSILLEQNPLRPGLYSIKLEDPAFDQVDVILDATNQTVLRATLSRFVSDADLPLIKEALTSVSPNLMAAVLPHFKPRVATANVGYDASGEALIELMQEDFKLSAACRRN